MIAVPGGLYIGDDTDFLNGTELHKPKLLPITADAIARPDSPSLPTNLIITNPNALEGASFDTSNFDTTLELQSLGWGTPVVACSSVGNCSMLMITVHFG